LGLSCPLTPIGSEPRFTPLPGLFFAMLVLMVVMYLGLARAVPARAVVTKVPSQGDGHPCRKTASTVIV